jgi:hypothetical protein
MPTVNRTLPPKNSRPTTQARPPTQTSSADDPWGAADYVRLLLYGRSGTGKTRTAATFPDPILWLLCSGGNRPGELRSVDTPENRRRIRPVVLRSSDQLRQELQALTGPAGVAPATVVLDHASGFSDLVLKEILGYSLDRELPAQKGWGLASQQQYGQCTAQCKEHLRALLNLPCNVVVIAQERTFGGDEGDLSEIVKPTVGPALQPSLAGWLGPACDYVCQTFIRPKLVLTKAQVGKATVETRTRARNEFEFCLRTGPHDVYHTKFRVPTGAPPLPDAVVLPDNPPAGVSAYDKILALTKGEPVG